MKLALHERVGSRFQPVVTSPRRIAEALVSDAEKIHGIRVEGTSYRPTERFYKSMASELGIPFATFGFFTPLEVMTRAAEKEPDIPLRMTVDTEAETVLGVTQNKGLPMPIRYIENVLHDDSRLQEVVYEDGVMSATLDLDEKWDVPNDGSYHVHVRCRVPVDGVGAPDMSLATWRQVCSNGAVAEAPIFRTRMEIKDNSGEHFRRLLGSFSNPSGVELLQQKMCDAAGTKASVGELVMLENMVKRSVKNARNQMLLRERLYQLADDPCVRYGVTDLSNIGEKKRVLLPVGCSVADLLNFASEVTTHHAEILNDFAPLRGFSGTILSRDFDLMDLYPNTRKTSSFYLKDISFAREVA